MPNLWLQSTASLDITPFCHHVSLAILEHKNVASLTYLLFLQMGYELGEKADEVEEDDDGAVEVGRVSSPPLTGLQRRLASLHLTNCPLEYLNILGVFISFL